MSRGEHTHYLDLEDSDDGHQGVVSCANDPDSLVILRHQMRMTQVLDFGSHVRRIELPNARLLTKLGDLPPDLKILNLTGCLSLPELPLGTKLPKLRILALGACTSLDPENLRRFLAECVGWNNLQELDLFQCPGLEKLVLPGKIVPKLLEQVDLQGCENLKKLPDWSAWPKLRHINLQGCGKVQKLPKLPLSIDYLLLHECERLSSYLDHDLNHRERGDLLENVADAFRFRTRFAEFGDPVERPRTKVILLGDGRAGKTTFAKALQYRELNDEERKKLPELEPSKNEDPTHAIRMMSWKPTLKLPGKGDRECDIQLWDFGGQEMYHGTHRTFAASGALFLLMVSPEPPDLANQPKNIDKEDWKEMNRPRGPRYWLEYIRDLDPDAKVLVVHTHHSADQKIKSVKDQVDKDLKGMVKSEFGIDSLNEWHSPRFDTCAASVKNAIAAAVLDEGLSINPVEAALMERVRTEAPTRPHCNASEWQALVNGVVQECYQGEANAPELDASEHAVVTRTLHRAGVVFQLSGTGDVLLDQPKALSRIYSVTDPVRFNEFRKHTKNNYGRFRQDALYNAIMQAEAEENEKNTASRAQTDGCINMANFSLKSDSGQQLMDQIFAFMEDCQVAMPLFSKGDHGVDGMGWQGLNPFLLPVYPEAERNQYLKTIQPEGMVLDEQTLSPKNPKLPFSRDDFRMLMVYGVKQFRDRLTCWQDCFELVVDDPDDSAIKVALCFQWVGTDKEGLSYNGYLKITCFRPDASPPGVRHRQLDMAVDWFLGRGSPFPFEYWDEGPPKNYHPPSSERYDVGLFYSSSQSPVADAIYKWCKEKELKCMAYTKETFPDLDTLRSIAVGAKLTILLLSKEFLSAEPANEYCQMELVLSINWWKKWPKEIGIASFDGDDDFSINRRKGSASQNSANQNNVPRDFQGKMRAAIDRSREAKHEINRDNSKGSYLPEREWIEKCNHAEKHVSDFAKACSQASGQVEEGSIVRIKLMHFADKKLKLDEDYLDKLHKQLEASLSYLVEAKKANDTAPQKNRAMEP